MMGLVMGLTCCRTLCHRHKGHLSHSLLCKHYMEMSPTHSTNQSRAKRAEASMAETRLHMQALVAEP